MRNGQSGQPITTRLLAGMPQEQSSPNCAAGLFGCPKRKKSPGSILPVGCRRFAVVGLYSFDPRQLRLREEV
jgi:hypothetical protein